MGRGVVGLTPEKKNPVALALNPLPPHVRRCDGAAFAFAFRQILATSLAAERWAGLNRTELTQERTKDNERQQNHQD